MGPIVCYDMSVRNYHYTLLIDAEERSPFPLRGGRLKSRTFPHICTFKTTS